MLKSISEIGLQEIQNTKIDETRVFIEESNLKNTKKVLCIVLEKIGHKIKGEIRKRFA